jgi:hypothetical protein
MIFKKNFWNTIHDGEKVCINLLSEKNVESYEVDGDVILVIEIITKATDRSGITDVRGSKQCHGIITRKKRF